MISVISVESVKYGVFSSPNIPVFRLNTEIYFVYLHIKSKYRKYEPEITPYLATFHAVQLLHI